MTVKTADRSLLHLYPLFRTKLTQVLKECEQALGEPFVMVEGFRSQARQTFLWNQGRSMPGQIVTWLRSPLHHGAGLAADCIPKKRGYDAPHLWWETYRRIYHSHGLDNPAWKKWDYGHVQMTDPAIRARALVWVRNGFKEPTPDPPPAGAVSVIVDGQPVPDAEAYLEGGKAWVKLRPVADGLDLVIAEVTKGTPRQAVIVDDESEWRVPVVLKRSRAFVRATDLPAGIYWVGGEKLLSITPRRRG